MIVPALYGEAAPPPPIRSRMDAALPACRRAPGTVVFLPAEGPPMEGDLVYFAGVLRRNGVEGIEGPGGLLARLAKAVELAGCAVFAVDGKARHVVPVIARPRV